MSDREKQVEESISNTPDQDKRSDEEIITTVVKKRSLYAGKSLIELIKKYSSASEVIKSNSVNRSKTLSHFQHTHPLIFKFLLLFPWVLLVLFIVARFWDFNGMSFVINDKIFHLEGLLTIISVSGLIGFLTNWLAITMLFNPRKKRPLLGQGLVPSQKERIAYRLAQAVSRDLINPEIIKRKIEESKLIAMYRERMSAQIKEVIDNQDFRQELKQVIIDYTQVTLEDAEVRAVLAKRILESLEKSIDDKQFEKFVFKTYQYLRGNEAQEIVEKAISSLSYTIEEALDKMDDWLDTLPNQINEKSPALEDWISSTIYKIIQQFDVHSLIEENINKFEEEKLESLIKGTTNEQLRYIQYVGAVLGAIGGFVIWEPLPAIVTLIGLAALLFGADHIIYTYQEQKQTRL